jgi:hypothetical protein
LRHLHRDPAHDGATIDRLTAAATAAAAGPPVSAGAEGAVFDL